MNKSIFLTSVALASVLNAQQVQSIKYVNLSMVSQNIADDTIGFDIGDDINNRDINSAIKKFYKFGYFDDISVQNNNGNIEFIFKEKPTIANVEINGYKSREDDIQALSKRIGLAKGSMYSASKAQKAKASLLKELESEGYVNSVVEVNIEPLSEDAVSISFDVNKGEEIIIKKVNYFGSENLDNSDFEKVTANKEKEFAGWFFARNDGEAQISQLQYDNLRIQDEYFKNGFLDSKVDNPFMKVDFSNNSATLDFIISEGKQYSVTSVKIYVDSEIIDENILYEELRLEKDKIFDISKLRADQKFIKTQVADLGYAFTQVKYDLQKNPENGTVDVVFNVVPGEKVFINDVFISGNTRTLDRVIRRNVYLAPGDLFNLTDFNDSKNKLNRSGFFENVVIQQKRVSADKMDIMVEVKETATGNIILGGGYGSYDGILINAEINEKNVFGSGKTVGFSVDTSDRRTNFKISYKDPALNDSRYTGSFEIHSTDTEIEYSAPDYILDKKTLGFSASVGRELIRNLYGGVTYRFNIIEENYTDNDFTDTYDPFVDGGKINEEYINSALIPYLSFNNTDDHYFPRSGINAKTSLEYAGVGGDSEYIKSVSNFKYFYSLENRFDLDWVIRYRAKLGLLIDNGKITQGDSFYLGGTGSVRGYEAYSFGPEASTNEPALKNMFANSIELSLPLIPSSKMRWGLFYDYGMIGESSFGDTKRSGTGALVEWISPFGPMQFIFAEALDAEPGDQTSSFEFALGSQF